MTDDYLSINNQDVAIYLRVNELAQRWRLKPSDFLARIEYSDLIPVGHATLEYECSPKETSKKERFVRMLSQLDINGSEWSVTGTTAAIIDKLDNAIELAPRSDRAR